jgi:hypothetical protein
MAGKPWSYHLLWGFTAAKITCKEVLMRTRACCPAFRRQDNSMNPLAPARYGCAGAGLPDCHPVAHGFARRSSIASYFHFLS